MWPLLSHPKRGKLLWTTKNRLVQAIPPCAPSQGNALRWIKKLTSFLRLHPGGRSTGTPKSSPDNPTVDGLAPQLNIIMPTPLRSPEKGHHSDKLSSVVTIDPLLLYVRSEHPSSPAPEQTRPPNSPINPPLPPTNPIPAE